MRKLPIYWKTGDGREINIQDMDLPHLHNVLRMIVNLIKERVKQSSNE